MPSSSYADIETYQLAPLRKAIHQDRTEYEVMRKSIFRLCGEAFRNQTKAFTELEVLLAEKGVAKVRDILDDKGWTFRTRIGYLRGSVLDPAGTRRAAESLATLKTQVGTYAELTNRLSDRQAAYRAIVSAAGSPTSSPTPIDGMPIWGGQPETPGDATWYHKPVNGSLNTIIEDGAPVASTWNWFRKRPTSDEDDAVVSDAGRDPPGFRPR